MVTKRSRMVVVKDFEWENTSNYIDEREIFCGGFGTQGAKKNTNDSLGILKIFVWSTILKWVPCHHSVMHLQVVDREDGHQTWRITVNIVNKNSQTAKPGWSFSLGD